MAEPRHGEAQPRFDRAERQPQQSRDVTVGATLEERELDDFGLLAGKLPHRRAHAPFALRGAQRFVGTFCFRGFSSLVERPSFYSLILAQAIDPQIARDGIDPGRSAAARRVELRRLAPD